MANKAINIGRGPKSAVTGAIEQKLLGPLDLVVTKEENGKGGELILVDEDSSQVLITPRTQKDVSFEKPTGKTVVLPAGSSLDDLAEAALVTQHDMPNSFISLFPNDTAGLENVYIYDESSDSFTKTLYIGEESAGIVGLGEANVMTELFVSSSDDIIEGSITIEDQIISEYATVENDSGWTFKTINIPSRVKKYNIHAVGKSSIDDMRIEVTTNLFIDVRFPEVFSNYETAANLAATHKDMYEGQTVKVKNADGTIGVYTLEKSNEEGKNLKLVAMATASGADGVKTITSSEIGSNRVVVQSTTGSETRRDVVAIPGALYGAEFDKESGSLTFKRATDAENENGQNDETVTLDLSSLTDDHTAVVKVGYYVDPETSEENTFLLEVVTHTAGDSENKSIIIPINSFSTYEIDSENEIPAIIEGHYSIDEETNKPTAIRTTAPMRTVAFSPNVDTNTGVFTISYVNSTNEKEVITLDVKSISKSVIPTGGVANPSYDVETRTITLPVQKEDGTAENLVIALGKDLVVSSGRYDIDTKEIILVLNNDTEVKIPAAALVDVYTGKETITANVTVSAANEISVDVKVATIEGGNLLKKKTEEEGGGLYVDPADFATDEATIESITQIVTEKVIGDIMGPTPDPDPENPDQPVTPEPVKVKDYVDNSISDATGLGGVTNEDGSQMNVKDYVDSQTLAVTSKFINFTDTIDNGGMA